MLLSIVACEPRTLALGAAVVGDGFATAAGTIRLQPGAGVLAQIGGPARWATTALERLGRAARADDALGALADGDDAAADAQLAVVDARGRVGAFTGSQCRSHAGHAVAEGVVVQACAAVGQDAWTAPLEAYRNTALPLPRRLLAALAALAPHAPLGLRSAALVVVGPGAPLDLRVDDASHALDDLARLLDTHEAHDLLADARSRGAAAGVRAQAARRAVALAPDDPACLGAAAEVLALDGAHDEAQRLVQRMPSVHARNLAADLKARAAAGEVTATAHFYALLRTLTTR